MTTATRRRSLAGGAALTILVLAGACSSGSGDSMSDTTAGGADVAAERAGSADQAAAPVAASLEEAPADALADAPPATETDDSTPAKVISNGAVQLKSDDVGQAIFDVRNVVDKYAGEVEANATETDDEGEPLRSRLKVRVPTAQFDQAMQDLEGVATLIASSGNTEDVTTEVLDRTIRIQVQRRSIDRISVLLDRAVSIRDVVAIEAQLSQRQADLAVLEKEQRYLDDQTSMATINVSVERIKAKKPAPKTKGDDSGFFSGLSSGWDGLKAFGDGVATVIGALLPWMIVAAILAIPGLPLYRRLRRREVVAAPAPSPAP